MAFLIQNDSGSIDGANAYVTVAEFRAYHLDRGNDVDLYSDAQIQGAIIRATDHVDFWFRFVGETTRVKQRTAWPRVGAEDSDELLRVGIPVEVKEATSEFGLLALTQDLDATPSRDEFGRVVQSRTNVVGPIEESVTYAAGVNFVRPVFPRADRKLSKLLERAGEVSRG